MRFSLAKLIVIIIFLTTIPSLSFAESISMTAIGEYVMGDNDTFAEGKRLALQDAKRLLLEKVGTYVESTTVVKNGAISTDEIKQYTAGIVKTEVINEERTMLDNKGSVVKVNIRASVDPNVIVKQIKNFRSQKNIEESSKGISAENDKLRTEIAQLNQQLRNAVNDEKYSQLRLQREQILNRIEKNETGLTMMLSGQGLYAAAISDRMKKDNDKQKVDQILLKIGSAYKLKVFSPEVEDLNNGNSQINLPVIMYLPVQDFQSSNNGRSLSPIVLPELADDLASIGLYSDISGLLYCIQTQGGVGRRDTKGSRAKSELMEHLTTKLSDEPLYLDIRVGNYTADLVQLSYAPRSNRECFRFNHETWESMHPIVDPFLALGRAIAGLFSSDSKSSDTPKERSMAFQHSPTRIQIVIPTAELPKLSQMEAKIRYIKKEDITEGRRVTSPSASGGMQSNSAIKARRPY